jgi:hypothetical protein
MSCRRCFIDTQFVLISHEMYSIDTARPPPLPTCGFPLAT